MRLLELLEMLEEYMLKDYQEEIEYEKINGNDKQAEEFEQELKEYLKSIDECRGIPDDLMAMCEDNEVMREAIKEYFNN